MERCDGCMKCPVCDKENASMLCPECGFDLSKAYSRFPTFAPVGKVQAASALKQEWVRKKAPAEEKPVQWEDSVSLFLRARAYEKGEGVEKNLAEAAKWYRKAADRGCSEAQFRLGYCYYHGQGVKQDYEQAVFWYRESAEQGNASAQNNLGLCYYHGDGVKEDREQAVFWYRKSADRGDMIAQYHLADCYYYGTGVKQDYRQAADWYRKSAEKGFSVVYLNLGQCYEALNDLDQAIEWYQKANESGGGFSYEARFYQARCYAKRDGDGGGDRTAAKLYYKLALIGAEKAEDFVIAHKIREAQKELKKKRSIFHWWK